MYNSHYQGLVSSGSSPTKINRKKFLNYFSFCSLSKILLKERKNVKGKRKQHLQL